MQRFAGRRAMRASILVMALLLTLKLAGLVQALQQGSGVGTMVAAAQAEPAPSSAGPAIAPGPIAAADPVSVPIVSPAGPEPAISPAERHLLQDLRTRHAELDAREQTLSQREGVLAAAEHRLTARIAEMAGLQARLEQLETARREHDEANWAGLVKVYETMKPREAAAIFNDMEMPVLLEVIDRMKDAKAAQVLGAMQPDRARLLTGQLAAQRVRGTTVPPEHASAG